MKSFVPRKANERNGSLTHAAGRAEQDIQDIALVSGRHIPVPGTYNLRDLGGYPTLAGGRVRWRTLFRSDGLHRLDAGGRAALAGLGLRTIVDLRADVEVDQAPSAVAGLAARTVRMPIVRDLTVLPTELGAIYQYMIDERGAVIGAVIKELCAPGALPALVHCSAGKDRTGIVIALALAALGVPDELIGADYSLSAAYLDPDITAAIGRLRASGLADQVTSELLASPPALILDVLARARSIGGGSVGGYLMVHGVSAAELAALRSTLAR
jgi:protein-tyrosine phosphatase